MHRWTSKQFLHTFTYDIVVLVWLKARNWKNPLERILYFRLVLPPFPIILRDSMHHLHLSFYIYFLNRKYFSNFNRTFNANASNLIITYDGKVLVFFLLCAACFKALSPYFTRDIVILIWLKARSWELTRLDNFLDLSLKPLSYEINASSTFYHFTFVL